MNANIFSCTVPSLLVLETQIIHPELLQSLCINPCVPLGSIFWQTYARGRNRLRVHVDRCARAQTGKGARRRLRTPLPVCARAHPSTCALCQRRSRFDTSASLKLPTVKKKIGKKIFRRRCPPKEDGRTSMSVRPRPKPTSKPPCPSS